MIKPSTLSFLTALARNNNKTWFDEHRDEYVIAKDNFASFVSVMLEELTDIEPALREQQTKDCIFRIFRDVRFSKDKTPYKSHFGAYFSRGGRKFPGAGYYIQIEAGGKSFAGGGLWMPESPLLKAVRQEIDYNFDEFEEIVGDNNFLKLFKKLEGEQLKTLPQGYSADNPAIEFLKMKSFIASHQFTDKEVTNKNFPAKLTETFKAMRRLVDFLNRAVD